MIQTIDPTAKILECSSLEEFEKEKKEAEINLKAMTEKFAQQMKTKGMYQEEEKQMVEVENQDKKLENKVEKDAKQQKEENKNNEFEIENDDGLYL